MDVDILVDARGESCPMPLLRAKMALNKMESGQCLQVLATDAGSVRDFESFIKLTEHTLSSKVDGEEFIYYIVKS